MKWLKRKRKRRSTYGVFGVFDDGTSISVASAPSDLSGQQEALAEAQRSAYSPTIANLLVVLEVCPKHHWQAVGHCEEGCK